MDNTSTELRVLGSGSAVPEPSDNGGIVIDLVDWVLLGSVGLQYIIMLIVCLALVWRCCARKKQRKSFTFKESSTTDNASEAASSAHKHHRDSVKKRKPKAQSDGIYSSVHLSTLYDEIHSTSPNATTNITSNITVANPNYKSDVHGKNPVQGAYSLLRHDEQSLGMSEYLGSSPQYSDLSGMETNSPTRSMHLQVPEITISHPLPPSHPLPNVKPSAAMKRNGTFPRSIEAMNETGNSPKILNVQSKSEEETKGRKEETASLGHYSLAGSESHYSVARNNDGHYSLAGSQDEREEDCLDELVPASYEEFYSSAIVHSSESEGEYAEEEQELGLQIKHSVDSIYSNIGSSHCSRHSTAISEASYQDQLVKENVVKVKRPVSAMMESHRLHQLQRHSKKPFTSDGRT